MNEKQLWEVQLQMMMNATGSGTVVVVHYVGKNYISLELRSRITRNCAFGNIDITWRERLTDYIFHEMRMMISKKNATIAQ